jgi:hypothetical protein
MPTSAVEIHSGHYIATSLPARLETRREIVTLNAGLHVRSSIPGLRHGYESSCDEPVIME